MKKLKFTETLKDLILSFDFLGSQPNLFLKGQVIQHTFLGFILSSLIYITVIILFCYLLFIDNKSLSLTYGRSVLLESNIMHNPVLFRLFVKETGEPLPDDHYQTFLYLPFQNSYIDDRIPVIKCGTFKNNTEYMNKYSKVLNTIKDWEDYYCVDPNNTAISHTSNQLSSENYLSIDAKPRKMLKYINKTLIFSVHNIFPDAEYLLDNHEIKYKSFDEEYETNVELYYEIGNYFTNTTYIIEGNEINKCNKKFNFVEYQFTRKSYYSMNRDYDFYDFDGNLNEDDLTFRIISMDFFLEDKNPVYKKTYKKFSDIIGNIGGIINIIMIVTNFINKLIIGKIINFDVVYTFFGDHKTTYKKQVKKKLNLSTVPSNKVKNFNVCNTLKNNYIDNKHQVDGSFEKILRVNNNNTLNLVNNGNNIYLSFKSSYLNALLYIFPLGIFNCNSTLKNNIDVFQYCFNYYFSFEALHRCVDYIKLMNKKNINVELNSNF